MVRNVLAVVAGFVTVGVTVAGLQWLSASLAFGSELLGAFLGGLVAGRLASSHRARFALALVALAAAASVMNWVAFPHPVWFMVGQAVLYPVVFLGVRAFLPAAAPPDPSAGSDSI